MTVANGEVTREVPVMPGGQRSDPACAHCHDLGGTDGKNTNPGRRGTAAL